ncbi:MAG TPA: serine--tRNA ligase [Candidatus Limnocylindrales bacterium]|jgi:seryl-tRNA synthetase|nr:serine--tRNA ligase [Candidatus Limnocylindrales bacterium]
MSVGLQRLRDDAEAIRRGARDKGEDPGLVDQALELDTERRRLLTEADAARAERKELSVQVGAAMKTGGGPEADELRARSQQIGSLIERSEAELRHIEARIEELLLRIPNPADPDVPVGGDEATVTVRTWGEPVAHAADGWTRRPHWEIGAQLGLFDLAAGAKVTGSGFPVYRAAGAALQRALINMMLDLHAREHGMTEIWPPVLVNEASARGTGQIPDKEDQMYVVGRDELYLIPTAEVPVTNIHRDEIIEADRLPIRYVAYSPCFRREAGAAGARTRGLLRLHQFDKVEMVAFERPADSDAALEWMTERAEVALQRLGLAYRVRLMATREAGFTQAKKYDLEVWSPGVEEWLEVSSVSNFRDFQARRMNIRWRPAAGSKPEILHTLNGSSLGFPRTVAALLEVYQQPDGSIALPPPLRGPMGTDVLSG